MFVQAAGFVLALALLDRPLLAGVLSAVFLGIGTAMVHPALIASVSDHAHPAWRAGALGTYRFWRDLGYAAGALTAGILADTLGLNATVIAAAVLTAGPPRGVVDDGPAGAVSRMRSGGGPRRGDWQIHPGNTPRLGHFTAAGWD